MAEFAEQKVHFGRGPRTVDVIWVAMGSVVLINTNSYFQDRDQTGTDL